MGVIPAQTLKFLTECDGILVGEGSWVPGAIGENLVDFSCLGVIEKWFILAKECPLD